MKPQLSAAHDAQQRADLLMAEKEGILRKSDPTRAKALLIAGREMFVDIEKSIAYDAETLKPEPVTVENVQARAQELAQDEDEDEMER